MLLPLVGTGFYSRPAEAPSEAVDASRSDRPPRRRPVREDTVFVAIRANPSTIGRDSPTSHASSIWLTVVTPRSATQTTSGEAICRTHAGATDTPNPALISLKMVSQCDASCTTCGRNPCASKIVIGFSYARTPAARG